MQKPLGIHHIRSKLFSLYLSKLPALYNSCLENHVKNPNSNEYKLTAIVLDIAGHRLFKPVGIKKDEIDKRSFLKLSFEKEDLDTLSEWMKCVRSLIQIRIKKNSMGLWELALHQSLKTYQRLLNTCLSSMTNMLLAPPTGPLTILFVCVNNIT